MAAGLLVVTAQIPAQVKYGDLSTNLSGSISMGYSGTYGNMTSSTHNWAGAGIATLSGSFYNPNFLNFNASMYLNQSRANSDFQSVSNASGFNLSTNIFAGSRFPGSITYSRAYNSQGNYAVPGLGDFVTHGNSDTFGIAWSENLTNVPSLTAGFQMGSSQYSVYGADNQGKNRFHSFNLHSGYTLAGFNMGAFYSLGASHSLIPQVVTTLPSSETNADSSAEGFNITHRIPLQGTVSANYTRSHWNSDYLGSTSNGTIDLVNGLVAIQPANQLSMSASVNYSTNLTGQLLEAVASAGGIAPTVATNDKSNSLDLMALITYTPVSNLQTSGFVERRSQEYMGQNYGVNSFGGSASYVHSLLEGTFNVAASVTENTSDTNSNSTLGFSTNANYSRLMMGWRVNGSFGYAQNVQTLLVTYMNSFYNYSGSARRRWGEFHLSMGAGGSRTALTQQAGTANTSTNYNASIGYSRFLTATGNYARSDGQALATGAGLVPVPIPPPTLPSDLVILFGGESYSFGLSSSPVKRLIIAATYGKSKSNTTSDLITSANQNNQFNTLIQYQFRKLSFTSGYARLEQGFSNAGTPPEVISSYYMGISRWFNFF